MTETIPDSGALLRSLVDQARADGPGAVVRVPPGRHHLWPETASARELYVSNTVGADTSLASKKVGLLLENLDGVRIEGSGAELVMHGRQTAIAVIGSRNVSVRGLTVDWEVPSTADVLVEMAGVDARGAWRLLSVPEGTLFSADETGVHWFAESSPWTGAPYWTGHNARGYCQVFEPDLGRTRRGACPLFEHVQGIETLDARRMLVHYTSTDPPNDVGFVYQLRETLRDHPGVLVDGSEHTAFTDVAFHYLHGFGLVAQGGRDLELNRVRFEPRPGSGRITAGFADFLQCSGIAGDVVVRDCVFDGPQDDPINVHGTYLAVAGSPEHDRLDLEFRHPETAGIELFSPGDDIEIVERLTLTVLARLRVVDVEGPSGHDHARSLTTVGLRLAGSIPEVIRAGATAERYAVENVSRLARVLITGSTFRRSPTRAILATTREVVVEKCVFEGIEMACIQVAADANSWWESGRLSTLLVENCAFSNLGGPAIEVAPEVVGRHPVHGDVSFRNNLVALDGPVVATMRGLTAFRAVGNKISGQTPPALVLVEGDADVSWPDVEGSVQVEVRRS